MIFIWGGVLCLDELEAASSENSVSPDLRETLSETLLDAETTIVVMRMICCVAFRIIARLSSYLGTHCRETLSQLLFSMNSFTNGIPVTVDRVVVHMLVAALSSLFRRYPRGYIVAPSVASAPLEIQITSSIVCSRYHPDKLRHGCGGNWRCSR
jgi:hypothetical protein